MICSSSRTFPSSTTSRIDEMEFVARVSFVGTAPEDRAGGALEEVAVMGLVAADRLCLELRGVRFTPSDTDARGREAEEATELLGDTTDGRVALAAGDGLTAAEADAVVLTGGFEVDTAEGFGGMMDSLRLGGAAAEGAGARAEAMDGLDGEDEELVDFLSRSAVEAGLTAALFVVIDGFTADDLTVPAPNVPELMI